MLFKTAAVHLLVVALSVRNSLQQVAFTTNECQLFYSDNVFIPSNQVLLALANAYAADPNYECVRNEAEGRYPKKHDADTHEIGFPIRVDRSRLCEYPIGGIRGGPGRWRVIYRQSTAAAGGAPEQLGVLVHPRGNNLFVVPECRTLVPGATLPTQSVASGDCGTQVDLMAIAKPGRQRGKKGKKGKTSTSSST